MNLWRTYWENGESEGRERAASLLREGLHCAYGIQTEEIQHDAKGRPFLIAYPHIHISISHGSDCCAVAAGSAPLGVDIEKIRPFRRAAARHAFTKEEHDLVDTAMEPNRMFFRLWTLKESYLKAIGEGLAFGMRNVSFSFQKEKIYCNQKGCRFMLYEDDAGFITAVCILKNMKEKWNGAIYSV